MMKKEVEMNLFDLLLDRKWVMDGRYRMRSDWPNGAGYDVIEDGLGWSYEVCSDGTYRQISSWTVTLK